MTFQKIKWLFIGFISVTHDISIWDRTWKWGSCRPFLHTASALPGKQHLKYGTLITNKSALCNHSSGGEGCLFCIHVS